MCSNFITLPFLACRRFHLNNFLVWSCCESFSIMVNTGDLSVHTMKLMAENFLGPPNLLYEALSSLFSYLPALPS